MSESNPVSRNTLYVTAFLCLVVGFVVGVVGASVYKKPQPHSGQQTAQHQQQRQQPRQTGQQGLSEGERQRFLELEMDAAKNPKDHQAWNTLGHFAFDHGQYKRAVDAYETSLNILHEQPDVWTDLGVMYRRTHQHKKAIDAFNTAIELNPDHRIARLNKGVVLIHDLNRKEEGLDSWRELVRMDPDARAPNGTPVRDLIKQLE
ncbi:tetratricopeptide repeat protein [Desulfohalovibrio reitneri]|uniref:tetratricopeptide repeat protein n=1 Tax=Desulfohalovibrio reitneri TaxID=1307759 RepID=UPI0004A76B7B|nr:tetratricopeptide repeat protein [Desulfohalovibrio reitneri]